jgi:hypothetical protein
MNTDLKIEETRLIEETPLVEPIWCATANVKKEIPFGEEDIIKKEQNIFAAVQKFTLSMRIGECVIMQLLSGIIVAMDVI